MGDDDLVCVLVIPKSTAVVEYFWIKLVPSYYRMIFTNCVCTSDGQADNATVPVSTSSIYAT